ncbi:hypothetical protein CASFOL_025673 [Castilleja foliolosa]|uniref:Leucine-rich repeat-containing N-terminal plant-type domain-containing protein n=1 Tax=Castilleja foliolosa TaxID=1961234 RepID=A0ABD3CUB3_9LAMI
MFSLPIVYADYQVDALYAFKQMITDDPGGVTQSWDGSLVDPCTWFHITCDSDKRVTKISLGGGGISGQLVPQLGKLKYLQNLELYNNTFSGSIPKEIGDLGSLITLNLHNNTLDGRILISFEKLTNLETFDVSLNHKLGGPISLDMLNLDHLKNVDVGNTDLCGPHTGRHRYLSVFAFLQPKLY